MLPKNELESEACFEGRWRLVDSRKATEYMTEFLQACFTFTSKKMLTSEEECEQMYHLLHSATGHRQS